MKFPCITSTALAALLLAALALPAHAQTGLLNDTGQTSCHDASNAAVACDATNTGNNGTRPHQDGRYGRDAAAAAGVLTKTGDGPAGFDFSCVLWNGTVINGSNCTAGLVANTTGTPSGTPSTDWACTKDNVTGLVWSLQTQGSVNWTTATGATYPDAGHNSASRCGYSTGWRLPTRLELLSIVHRGQTNPAIDASHFPGTWNRWYWTSEPSQTSPDRAWYVDFRFGGSATNIQTESLMAYARLVRSGP
jgi:hypothetical protein